MDQVAPVLRNSSSMDKNDDVDYKEHVAATKRSHMTPAQRQDALDAAIKLDPGPAPFGAAALHLYFIALVVCFCSGDNGFDGTVMGGINAMEQFQRYFGLSGAGSKTSIIFGIYSIGSITGTIPAAYLPDRFGRRFPMLFGNLILCTGAIVSANATSMKMLLVGRWLTGLGCSCAGTAAKSYLAEISPARNRGAYMGFLNSFYYVGQMTASGMMVSTGNFTSDYSWRLPLYIQLVPAALNALLIYTCPESPRWLFSVGKEEQARKILARYHTAHNDINSPVIEIEMDEIREKIEIDGQDKRWWDFRPLFATRADRYRTYMVIMIGTFGQLSGNGMITYFLPILLKNAGIVSQSKQLTLNFVNSVTSYVGALAGSFTVDRFGRRKILLSGTIAITCILALVTGLLSDTGVLTTARSNAGITFIYLFMVVFSFGWTAMQALYPAEVLGYSARAKGLAFLNICTQASSCINTFGLPVALEKLDWKVYLIFTIWDAFECVVIYFFIVETKGLTLEEISEVFEQPNPRPYSVEIAKNHKLAKQRRREEEARA